MNQPTPRYDMASGAPSASRRPKGKGPALPSGSAPLGSGSAHSRTRAPGVTPPTPTLVANASPEVESLKAAVEALRSRLEAQEAANKSLRKSNDSFAAKLEELRQPSSRAMARHEVPPPRRSRRHLGRSPSPSVHATGPTSARSLPIDGRHTTGRRTQALGRELKNLQLEAAEARRKARKGDAPVDDPNLSQSSTSTSSSSSDEDSDSSVPPSPPSSRDPSSTSSSSMSSHAPRADRRRQRRGRPVHPVTDLMEDGDSQKVIRPSNSRFKTLLDYRTYFLLLRSTKYTPSMVKNTFKMNRRLDGAFQGQEPFTGTDPLGVFSFLTTFRRACDAAGLSHGRAFPLLAFRLSGAAKKAFASAVNTTSGRKRYEVVTYGDGVNWLLKKYATHAAMASAYHDIITMSQLESELPRTFGTRVELACDRLDGLFDTQDVKDVFINGLSDLIKPNVRVLDSQFPDRAMSETVAAAQGYWEGAMKLRQSIRTSRPTTIKVGQIDQVPTRTVERPFAPPRVVRSTMSPLRDEARDPPRARPTDVCYNCNEMGHYAAQCTKPHRQRRQERVMAIVKDKVRQHINAIVDNQGLSTDSESDDAPLAEEEAGCSKNE